MPPQAHPKSQLTAPNGVSAKSRIDAKTVFAASFIALCAQGLPSGSAQAGFLDELFGAFTGGRRVEVPHYYGAEWSSRAARRHATSLSYIPRQWRPRRHVVVAHARADNPASAGSGAGDGLCYAVRPQGVDLGQADAILHDATLRAGDSVMTEHGLRVFEGGSACPHKADDFLALADARDVSKSKRGALRAIEKAMKTPVLSGRAGGFLESGEQVAEQP